MNQGCFEVNPIKRSQQNLLKQSKKKLDEVKPKKPRAKKTRRESEKRKRGRDESYTHNWAYLMEVASEM